MNHFYSRIESIVKLLKGKIFTGHYNNNMLLRYINRNLKGKARSKNRALTPDCNSEVFVLLVNIGMYFLREWRPLHSMRKIR